MEYKLKGLRDLLSYYYDSLQYYGQLEPESRQKVAEEIKNVGLLRGIFYYNDFFITVKKIPLCKKPVSLHLMSLKLLR